MTYEEALKYIHNISWTFCKPGLERIGELCEKLGNPQRNLKFVHVAGTNGKGSFSSMLSSILSEAGYKVGLYTSPYILSFNERMKVSGQNITDTALAEITEYVKPFADSMKDQPTEFELITAIAFEYFKRCGCDIVVLEAGMGGRLDSTNIIDRSLLSVITGIALDHTAFLGNTVEQIAKEKAGIIKPECPLLFGGCDHSAEAVISEEAHRAGIPFYTVDYSSLSVSEYTLSGTRFAYKGYNDLEIKLLGSYQPKNAAVVVEACDILKKSGINIEMSHIRRGLKKAVWHARFEIIDTDPLIIFDGAHNPQGIESATESIECYFPGKKVHALSGVLRDKDYRVIAKTLSRVCDKAFTITPANPRALSAEDYAAVLRENKIKATAFDSIDTALAHGIKEAKEDGCALVILGSLYTYVDVIGALNKNK